MREQLAAEVEAQREQGMYITNEEAQLVEALCYRKMEVAGVENPNDYILVLFPDELRNYLFRRAVNLKTALIMAEKEKSYV